MASDKSYAHQRYVQDDSESTASNQRNALLAAKLVTDTWTQYASQSIRWSFRGFIAYRCHVPDCRLYSRFTDDVDIAVHTDDFSAIDTLENVLLEHAPQFFKKSWSPSKLLKVHYIAPDTSLVRLDIYNTSMHSLGNGHYLTSHVEWLTQPRQFEECPKFECPVLPATALVDLKLVAFLERGHAKDLADVFFVLWSISLDAQAGLPWYAEQWARHRKHLSGSLREKLQEYMSRQGEGKPPVCFEEGLNVISSAEKDG